MDPLKLEKLRALQTHIRQKEDFYKGKWNRARSHAGINNNYALYCQYREYDNRIYNLITLMRAMYESEKEKGWAREFKHSMELGRWKGRLARKEKGRQEYLTKHKYSPWFMSNSLGADYGSYTCSKCSRLFYHSPSTITRANKEIYHCCCGYCTNEIISRDWGKDPYE